MYIVASVMYRWYEYKIVLHFITLNVLQKFNIDLRPETECRASPLEPEYLTMFRMYKSKTPGIRVSVC